MPKAWDKPTVNEKYKAERVRLARAAAAASSPADDFEAKLLHRVEQAGLKGDRAELGRQAVKEACAKLRAGDDPLSGLKPPPSCHACNTDEHGGHHFLCLRRARQPKGVEKDVKQSLIASLNAEHRARTYRAHENVRQPARHRPACARALRFGAIFLALFECTSSPTDLSACDRSRACRR